MTHSERRDGSLAGNILRSKKLVNFHSRTISPVELCQDVSYGLYCFYLLINVPVKQLSDMKTILLGATKTAETKTDCEKQEKEHRIWSSKNGKWNSVPGRPATPSADQSPGSCSLHPSSTRCTKRHECDWAQPLSGDISPHYYVDGIQTSNR